MDTNSEIKDDKERREIPHFYEAARRILLASIGAVALTHDEVEEFVDKLVDRGEIARKDGKDLIKEIRERKRSHFHGDEDMFHHRMEKFFEHFDVPAKKDFDELNEKIAALEKKIAEMTKPNE